MQHGLQEVTQQAMDLQAHILLERSGSTVRISEYTYCGPHMTSSSATVFPLASPMALTANLVGGKIADFTSNQCLVKISS